MVAGRADCCLAAGQGGRQTVKVGQLWFQAQLWPNTLFLTSHWPASPGMSPLPLPQHAAQMWDSAAWVSACETQSLVSGDSFNSSHPCLPTQPASPEVLHHAATWSCPITV